MEQKLDGKTEKTHKTNKLAIAIVLSGVGLFTAADLAGRYFINQKPAAEPQRSTIVLGNQEKPKPEPKA